MFGVMLFLTMCLFHAPVFCDTSSNSSSPRIFTDGSVLDISLLNYDSNTMAGKVLDAEGVLLPLSTITINIIDISPSVTFVILQTHSFFYNITLSHNEILSQNSYASGSNIGLVQYVSSKNSAEFFLLNQNYANNVSVLVAVQGYGRDAPVPGGCNMEFPVETAPYLGVDYNASVVRVDVPLAAAPAASLQTCEKQEVEVEIYHSYLPEGDFSRETYFEALRAMMTVQDLRTNANKVDIALQGPHTRRLFSAYTGTGSAYGVVAVAGFSGAAYVPAITYACDIASETERCEVLATAFSKVICAAVLFVGLFVCFFGHQFFMSTLFLLGVLFGGLVSYILVALEGTVDTDEKVLYSLLVGLAVGIAWFVFWCCCGVPFLAVLPAMLTLGYVVAAITMFTGVGDYQIFESDVNYWILFLCIVLSIPILLMSDSRLANIICCSVLGAYAVVVPIDHYIGSNLKFILLNTIRRATVKRFGAAVIDPPFQTKDMLLCAVWFGLACLGILFQWTQARGKPPFPAPYFRRRMGNSRAMPRPVSSERTPLIYGGHSFYGSTSTEEETMVLPVDENRSFAVLPKFAPTAPALVS